MMFKSKFQREKVAAIASASKWQATEMENSQTQLLGMLQYDRILPEAEPSYYEIFFGEPRPSDAKLVHLKPEPDASFELGTHHQVLSEGGSPEP